MFFTAFTDESYIDAERFRSICVFSLPTQQREIIENEISHILKESNVKEFKWKKIKDAKYRFCAIALIDFILNNIAKYGFRIDVIVWDISDSRHNIFNRDDVANFERMFFHLLKFAMKRRPNNACWQIYPDERTGINWDTVKQCLGSVGSWQEHIDLPLLGDFFKDRYKLLLCQIQLLEISVNDGLIAYSKTILR